MPEWGLVLKWGSRWYNGHCAVLALGTQFQNWVPHTTQFQKWASFLVPVPELGEFVPVLEWGHFTVPVPELGKFVPVLAPFFNS